MFTGIFSKICLEKKVSTAKKKNLFETADLNDLLLLPVPQDCGY